MSIEIMKTRSEIMKTRSEIMKTRSEIMKTRSEYVKMKEYTMLKKCLPFPMEIVDIIQSYLYQCPAVAAHNKHMRKICYIFKNANKSRFVTVQDQQRWIGKMRPHDANEPEDWEIDLSRKKIPRWIGRRDVCLRANRTIDELMKHISKEHPAYEAVKKTVSMTVKTAFFKREKKLQEKKFGKTNCKKCGHYKNCDLIRNLYSEQTFDRIWNEERYMMLFTPHETFVDYQNRRKMCNNRLLCSCI